MKLFSYPSFYFYFLVSKSKIKFYNSFSFSLLSIKSFVQILIQPPGEHRPRWSFTKNKTCFKKLTGRFDIHFRETAKKLRFRSNFSKISTLPVILSFMKKRGGGMSYIYILVFLSLSLYIRCSFSMMVKWANDGTLQANDGKILVNDGEMPINDGELSVWSYTHFTIIDKHFIIINKQFTIINEHFTIISLK